MDEDDLAGWIETRIAAADSDPDIVKAVCLKSGLSWPEVEELVARIRLERSQESARRRLPIWRAISLAALAAGLPLFGLLVLGVAELLQPLRQRHSTLSTLSGLWMVLELTPSLWGQAVLAAAPALAGAIGLRQTISEL